MRKATVLLAMVMAVCGSAMAGVSGDFIDFPLTIMDSKTNLSQTADLITMTPGPLGGLVAYNAGFGDAGSTDFSLAAAITFSNQTELGFCGRIDLNTLSLYEVSFNPVNNYLALVKITGGTTFDNLDLDQVTTPGFDAIGNTYDISFSANGSTLIGQMWDGDTLLAEVTATDSDYSSTVAGVFAFKHTDILGGTWAEVPEPTTMGLLAVGGVLTLIRRRRK